MLFDVKKDETHRESKCKKSLKIFDISFYMSYNKLVTSKERQKH